VLSSSSSSVDNSTAAATAVIGVLADKLAAYDWRPWPAASAVGATNTLLSVHKRWSTSAATSGTAGNAEAEQLQKPLLARAGGLPTPVLIASLQAMLNNSSGSSSVRSCKAAVIGVLAQGLVAADWSTLSAQSVAAA
jgi:hypothetical protein